MESAIIRTNRIVDTPATRKWTSGLHLLLLLAVSTDVITPFLIWKGVIPDVVRWLSHGAIALMILFCVARAIGLNHIPGAFMLVAGVSAAWVIVAVFQGQGVTSTIWGWWLLFQFPFVALFVYLQPGWSVRFPILLRRAGLALLILCVMVQVVQYLLGEPPGDNLAGTFGKNGTGNLLIFIFFLNCIFLGQWITEKRWIEVAITLVFSIMASLLGEMKFFSVGIMLIGIIVLILSSIRLRTFSLWRLLIYIILFAGAFLGFLSLYDVFIPGANSYPIQDYFTDPGKLFDYLNLTRRYATNGNYVTDLGRNVALQIGWESLQGDPVTFLFGYGIGARSESVTLGTSGIGISRGNLGNTTGTGLLIMMQELGMVGLTTLVGFIIWVVLRLSKDIRRLPHSPATGLRYALAIFTALWPLWLWYNTAWTLRVPNLFYWTALGYVLAEANGFPIDAKLKTQIKNLQESPQ